MQVMPFLPSWRHMRDEELLHAALCTPCRLCQVAFVNACTGMHGTQALQPFPTQPMGMRLHGVQVGSYMRLGGNRDIAAGQVFDIDLMQAPFGLDQPLLAYNELTCEPSCSLRPEARVSLACQDM